jgi:hypothetical protein
MRKGTVHFYQKTLYSWKSGKIGFCYFWLSEAFVAFVLQLNKVTSSSHIHPGVKQRWQRLLKARNDKIHFSTFSCFFGELGMALIINVWILFLDGSAGILDSFSSFKHWRYLDGQQN